MMLPQIFLLIGIALLSAALRSFYHPWLRKAGAICILVFSYFVGYFLTGVWEVGVACAVSWFFLPWLEIIMRIRKLRMPAEKKLRRKNPPPNSLTMIGELTSEIEDEKFEHMDDAGWDWEDYRQFFRIFYKEDERCQAAICVIEQDGVTFFYMSLSSRAADGTIWTTWNYPFSYSLKIVPQLRINRRSGEQSFLQMAESHHAFLDEKEVRTDSLVKLNSDEIQEQMQTDLRAQITYNLTKGVLTSAEEGKIRYSWRGLLFLWFQFLRDIARFS